MITTEPQVDPRGLYGLKDAAAALMVAPSTITRAVNLNTIECSIRRSNGRRVFTGQNIINYWRLTY